ncbi:BTAD domain-containing putative transcriptional regulator [Amycolatopsis rhabdoformis]|uniref:BTAD domain-containing putative transcriptional regulator n=1 Tax=Amycolatopsis rhabdoformis TaxID=1448059 RepID=A0ABZ1HVH6_9PSEU|nr:BTAD domain-containing putative transcriptional regulator [Amycolatopsis rhabdoformis]WSE26248.1 BTAD domain-containing putative transcriptional regulator [Amycolatopsis rhabdoformis]
MSLDFRLLGNVEVLRGEQPQPIGPAGPRAILVALLLEAGQPVSLDDLVVRVWGDHAPGSARGMVHSYFTRLRTALAGEHQIVRHGHGYVLDAAPERVDVHRFRHLIFRARRAEAAEEAVGCYDEALELWRGEPFAGLDSPWLREFRTALRAEHEEALLARTDLQLELGRHAQVLPTLTSRAGRHPFDERLAGQLMLALHRTGRQADALRHFQKVKAMLADELGVDPGPALRSVYQAILRDETIVDDPSPRAGAAQHDPGLPPPVPRQLPAPPRAFTGRGRELEALASAPVSVVVGPGGVGKTCLALRWAHDHAGRFPDGQLFVDLRGFAPSGERVAPETAVRAFLSALGVKPAAVPPDLAAMCGLYRSLVADKHLLVVIDNALDADQVIPLLPGNPRCPVVVTSRNRLTTLVTSHHADLLTLDVLDGAAARQLLVARLGPTRTGAEPAAVTRLADACGGLPLALSIVVGRAQEHPEFALTALADELADSGSPLNALEIGTDLSIRAVLRTSLAALAGEPAELFTLLGLVPGPDITLDAAASLAGTTYAATRTALRVLERASLVQQYEPGRFRLHDLVRAYARELAHDSRDNEHQTSALHRLTCFYLHSLVRAVTLADAGRPPITPVPLPPGCTPVPLRDAAEAKRWVNTEAANIAAVRSAAIDREWHRIVWQLTWGSSSLYATQGDAHHAIGVWREGLAAAQILGDRGSECLAERVIAQAFTRTGAHEEAVEHVKLALAIAEELGDVPQRVLCLNAWSEICVRAQRIPEAIELSSGAWELATDLAPAIRAWVGNHLAWALQLEKHHDEALVISEQTLVLADEANMNNIRPAILDTLGTIHLGLGNLDRAVAYLEEALALFGDEMFSIPDTLLTLGAAYRRLGRTDLALKSLRQAVELYHQQHREHDERQARHALDELVREGP